MRVMICSVIDLDPYSKGLSLCKQLNQAIVKIFDGFEFLRHVFELIEVTDETLSLIFFDNSFEEFFDVFVEPRTRFLLDSVHTDLMSVDGFDVILPLFEPLHIDLSFFESRIGLHRSTAWSSAR
ncbi:hypothetical protein Ab1vBOLIVR5_gp209 [Agrobacterium phage OLIVR5]|uniref:Uncharacterized protein n=1 Tax=Agrobacterium phage OLIVR5 TaxID=2723773 RepID=A0A858MSV7_9CAUD|nr:hypothetical protein KNU99_gp192 [Agrobacterium phage OLIVR5]QIW87857.1 hypothetical protein Ab1vBOLIVR5_gp209 [Agrobacterium phage OLIVR5]QIW88122.1 hypothetical protein Ab1vBOLIVR6_gp215 [Agrobacterium phage OLIVR6]